jgi:hypothetical protein
LMSLRKILGCHSWWGVSRSFKRCARSMPLTVIAKKTSCASPSHRYERLPTILTPWTVLVMHST